MGGRREENPEGKADGADEPKTVPAFEHVALHQRVYLEHPASLSPAVRVVFCFVMEAPKRSEARPKRCGA